MFVFSNRMVMALASSSREAYVRRLVEFLRSHYATAKAVHEEGLLAAIDKQVTKALQYDFKTEQQGAKYVLTAWLCGADFDQRFPDAHRVLISEIEPEDKASQLEYWCLDLFAELARDNTSS